MRINKPLIKIGNSEGIVIDNIIKKQLHIKKGDYVGAKLYKIRK